MTTTTEITSNAAMWLGMGTCSTILDALTPVAGDYVDDFDWEAIESEYRNAIQAVLPEGMSLCGEFILADVDVADELTEQKREIIRESVSGIDIVPMLERHDIAPSRLLVD